MSKTISIKLTKISPNIGPFNIYDQLGNVIAEGVEREDLVLGKHYIVDDSVSMVRLSSTGTCTYEKIIGLQNITKHDFFSAETERTMTGCIWKHMDNHSLYNNYYGHIKPYVIEYPFSYNYQDEILQNVKDYTRVFQYLGDPYGVTNEVNKIEMDDVWFNKAILYNGQQCSGLLNLVPKPRHNLQLYMTYPLFNSDSKTITYTKSDNFYQYNTFWSVLINKNIPIFVRNCQPLSIDKELNQVNMDYSARSFKKEPLRAKDLKVRHILDNRSDTHLISQFIYAPSQISYK